MKINHISKGEKMKINFATKSLLIITITFCSSSVFAEDVSNEEILNELRN